MNALGFPPRLVIVVAGGGRGWGRGVGINRGRGGGIGLGSGGCVTPWREIALPSSPCDALSWWGEINCCHSRHCRRGLLLTAARGWGIFLYVLILVFYISDCG